MAELRICLTGGIASGKTRVSDAFAEMGACVIDADVVAREVVAKGTPGLSQLVSAFGSQVLNQEGALDRQRLKKEVFNDPVKLAKLNAIVHPLVIENMQAQSAQNSLPIEVFVIPLFDGSPAQGAFDRVLVVDVSEKIQLSRVMKRDSLNEKLAQAIMAAQLSRQQRLALADDVLVNDSSLEKLDHNIQLMFACYVKMAGIKIQ